MEKHKPYGVYERFFKRPLDILCAMLALTVFCWLYAIVAILVVVIVAATSSQNKGTSSKSSSSKSSSSSSEEMEWMTYCMVYLKISDVKVKHSGNYAYVTGSIKNTGTSSVRYVKVKASCKDLYGNVIDTDWTYAVDTSWLGPGESKSFEMMIKDENYKIQDASVSIIYN